MTEPQQSINELPPELLLNIIHHVLDCAEYYNILYGLMLVCSSWSTFIKATPTLWSLVDKAHPHRLPLVLQRSNHAPLTIESYRIGVRPTFDRALFEQSRRWETALIEQSPSDSEGDLQRRLGEAAAPMLKTFHLVGRRYHSLKILTNPFQNEVPRLEELRLFRCKVSFESPIFDGLRTLDLAGTSQKRTSPASLFDMLRRCQRLTALTLTSLSFSSEGSDKPTPTIELPNLGRLHMRRLDEKLTIKLMSAVCTPHCEELVIRDFIGRKREDLPMPKSMPHLTFTFTSILRVVDRIILALEGDTFRFTAYLRKQRLFEFCGDFGIEALEVAATRWRLADRANVRLEVRVEVGGAGIEPLLNAFRALPNTTTIVLNRLNGNDVDRILDFLGEPFVGEDGVNRWYCPKLENFLMDGCGGAGGSTDNFLDLLENRYGGDGEHPRRLKYMHITIPDDCNIYEKKELRPLYEALKPEGMLNWTPGVPAFVWNIGDDDKENAEVSTDLEEDELVFECEFDWEEDEQDKDEGEGQEGDSGD